MATIPLEANNLRPLPAPPDLLGEYGKLQALKQQQAMAPLQQQAAQQQVQNSQLQGQGLQQENQIRERQIQDSQILGKISPQFIQKDASGKVTGYDYGGYFGAAASSGVSSQTLLPLQKAIYETTMAKANSGEAQLKLESSANQQAFNHLEGLRGTQDPTARQQLWSSALQWAQQNQQILGMDATKLPQQVPNDDGLTSLEAGLGMHAQMLDNATKLALQKKENLANDSDQAKLDYYKTHGGAPGVTQTDTDKFVSNWMQTKGLADTPANRLAAQQEYTKETKLAPAQIRVDALGNAREMQLSTQQTTIPCSI